MVSYLTIPCSTRRACLLLDHLDEQFDAIDAELLPLALRLYRCQVLCRQWGIGPVLAATILVELSPDPPKDIWRSPCAMPWRS
jgi:hypothetical protein